MNNSFVRRVALLASVIFVFSLTAMAQTATRPRPTVVTSEQASYRHAHQHGYRAGYEDGFIKGKSDFNENLTREFDSSDAYIRADRGYKESLGTLVEFQEGYRLGFEFGYGDGYFGRAFSASLPANLSKVVVASLNASTNSSNSASTRPREVEGSRPVASTRQPDVVERPRDRVASNSPSSSSRRNVIVVRDGVQMKVRLNDQISTKTNREGDRFTAVVLDPSDYADAVIEGHIGKLSKSGKASGKTELSLVFDSIHMRDGREGRVAAQVEKIYQSEKVKTVDDEGNVRSSSRTKDTAVRTGGGAVLGGIIGGVAGGGKGAAIGAIIGAGVGAGSVFVEGGKEMTLEPGTELLIRTAAPASSKE